MFSGNFFQQIVRMKINVRSPKEPVQIFFSWITINKSPKFLWFNLEHLRKILQHLISMFLSLLLRFRLGWRAPNESPLFASIRVIRVSSFACIRVYKKSRQGCRDKNHRSSSGFTWHCSTIYFRIRPGKSNADIL